MALQLKNMVDVYGMKVFTDDGLYFGDVEEVILADNRIERWRIKSTRGSFLDKMVGSARGVLVPHQLIRAVGEIVIMSKAAIPTPEVEEGSAPTE